MSVLILIIVVTGGSVSEPKASYVKLIVYDVLGREITTLVNEKLNAGRYEVNWNGNSYSSGIYYYKLITGEFVDIKKMVLLK